MIAPVILGKNDIPGKLTINPGKIGLGAVPLYTPKQHQRWHWPSGLVVGGAPNAAVLVLQYDAKNISITVP